MAILKLETEHEPGFVSGGLRLGLNDKMAAQFA
jgi:hypothetical protein